MATKKRRPKYQVLLVPISAATPQGTLTEASLRLDPDYKFVTGVAVSVGTPGSVQGPSYVDIGLRDVSGTWHDDCHLENWQANAGVRPDEKFKSFLIPITGQLIFGRVTTPATGGATGALFNIQFIFRIEDTMEVVAAV